ncbi:hypothetical protein MA16_Dca027946 [Dendrobium catenatum]|uniref:Uncharacterized protein n=1 Tax=Dendrobium catenatum TaxID=906689 RepID=A0A2I0VAD0_9ASPA|nr:hypothetical protein MA16_Dca027946 [Dendrobium catenatum]
MASITTFQDLLDRVVKFEKLNISKSESLPDRPKKAKAPDARRNDVYSAFPPRLDKGKKVVYNVDKGNSLCSIKKNRNRLTIQILNQRWFLEEMTNLEPFPVEESARGKL